MKNKNLLIIFICIYLSISTGLGCGPAKKNIPTKTENLIKLSSSQYPYFSDSLNFSQLSKSISASIKYFERLPKERTFEYGKDKYSCKHLIKSLKTFAQYIQTKPIPQELNKFIAQNFIVYESQGNENNQVLFTGYFEPTYYGSLTKDETNIYPLFPIPQDLLTIDLSNFSDKYKGHKKLVARVENKTVKPYFARKDINQMEDFAQRALPIAWLRNRVDRFFLEIQGSGQIILPDNNLLRVHYAGSNGNAYNSVGRYLIKLGEIEKEDMSMQAIRKWLETNPHRMDEILHQNESFVFFQLEDGGPYGSLSVELTPLRSIALDQGIFPRGALCFAMTALPDSDNLMPRYKWEQASLFLLHQDTGGAIKGTGRGDIFCGNGNAAQFTAGNMNNFGRLFFLVLKSDNK